MDSKSLSSVLKEFDKLTSKPEDFLSCNTKHHDRFKSSTKLIYDFCKNCENNRLQDTALPELIVKHFDDEQIWQELELQNNSFVDKVLGNVVGLVTKKDSINFLTNDGKTASKVSKTKTKKQKNHVMDDDDDDEKVDESDNTDEEIEKIKSRLDESDNDVASFGSDDDDMDFDFGSINPLHKDEDDESDDDRVNENDDKVDENADESDSDKEIIMKKKVTNKKPTKGSIVDDKFFKLAEMEAFLEQEDAREMKRQRQEEKGDDGDDEDESSDDDDIDMFADFSSDEGEEDAKYGDFFDPPEGEQSDKKKVKFKASVDQDASEDEPDSNEDDGDNDGVQEYKSGLFDSGSEGEDVNDIFGGSKTEEKSAYEKRQEKLKEKIKKMEEASLETRSWQMAGESTSSARPENSLLEEHLMFDHIAKIPKVITEETTEDLESMIKRRIKDKAWDDVERKIKPKENPYEYKKRIVLDQEKSKQSLGEIYEQEYLKQQKQDEEEKTDPDHDEIKKMMQSLFVKLDALSNFHYTPKPAAPEIKIVSNMPTISMEEVAPVSVSENNILAPEEVQDKMKGELKAASERTETDKKRNRRLKKNLKQKKQREKARIQKVAEKLNPGLGNKYSKEKAVKELEKQSKAGKGVTMIKDGDKKKNKSLTSSKSFFTQLQEEVTTQIKSKKADKRKKDTTKTVPSKKLKL